MRIPRSVEFWLNLHHFLYVLGRAEANMPDATRDAVVSAPADAARGLSTMTESEQRQWRQAVEAYASGSSRQDLVFDATLVGLGRDLARADDLPNPIAAGVDATVAGVLEAGWPRCSGVSIAGARFFS